MRPKMWAIGIVTVFFLSLLVAGCGGKQAESGKDGKDAAAPAKEDKVITIGLDADPPKLDPHLSSAMVDRQVFQSLYDKLVDIDQELKIVPMLAEKWEISPDGRTYTFHLRKGVLFHDGTPFNAEAVKFNFERMLDPKMASPRKDEVVLVDQVTVVNESTVKIDLKKPFAPFLYVLSDRAGMMVSPAAVKKEGDNFLNNPVGTGPFRFSERVKGDRIVLVKNEKYWQAGFPKVDKIVFKGIADENVRLVNLKSGQLDIMDRVAPKDLPSLQNDAKIKLLAGPGLWYQGLWVNTARPPFDNKYLRQAVSLGIDRKAMVKVVFGEAAVPSVSPFPPGSPAYDQSIPIPARDLAKVKELLGKGGRPDGFSFTLKIAPNPINQQIGQVIQNMLGEAGIKVNLEQVEFGTLLDQLKKGNFETGAVGWSGRPDPDGNIYAFNVTKGGFNYSGYSNPKVDSLLNEAREVTEMAKRKEIYSQIVRTLNEDVPYIYLYHPLEYKAYNPAVQGLVPVPDGMIRTVNLSK